MRTEANDSMHPIAENVLSWDKGLTKREYFAAMAMQGMLANDATLGMTDKAVAESSVKIADHLIEQLNQQQP